MSENPRLIKIAFEKLDAEGNEIERGFENETGTEFENVLEAASFLSDEGAIFASASDARGPLWFETEPQQDFKTGDWTRRSFHLSGFPQVEIESLFFAVTNRTYIGNPLALDFTLVDEFEESLDTFILGENGKIISGPGNRLDGEHVGVFYAESFFTRTQQTETKTALSEAVGVASDDFLPGHSVFEFSERDAIYFGLTDKRFLITSVSPDGKAVYEHLSREAVLSKAEEASLKSPSI